MDPKMDSGVGAENVHTLEEAIEAKFLPPAQALTIQQLIGILDQLFILLVLNIRKKNDFIHSFCSRTISSLSLSLSIKFFKYTHTYINTFTSFILHLFNFIFFS
jgi:hypothetical protein